MRMDQRSSGPLLAAILGVAAGGCGDTEDKGSNPTMGSSVAPSGADSNGSNSNGSNTGNTPSSTAPAPGVGQASATNDGTTSPSTAGSVDDGAGTTTPTAVDTGSDPSATMGETTTSEPTATTDPPMVDDAPTSEPAEPGDAGALGENDGSGEMETSGEDDMQGDAIFGPDVDGSCTASQPANSNASGSGPYEVIIETNSDSGINEGTIFRPAQLGGDELFPIFVWGQGGCSLNGLSNAASMAEIASHGYFVVADGSPNGSGSRMMNTNDVVSMGEPLLAYIDWALTENAKPCSAYYHALDATKIAANGFSCGGLMSTGTAGDPRMTTWGSTSSGTFSANQALYQSVHTPVLIIEGGPSDIAYENGVRDYENISPLGHPIMFFSKDIGHGGDLFQGDGGDFTKINLAWLNWWLKGDETQSGKGLLVGAGCSYCTDNEWEVMSANVP